MDAKLKNDWVAALRSGDYMQGQKKLYDPDSGSYCCLGVLCAVMGGTFNPANLSDEGLDNEGGFEVNGKFIRNKADATIFVEKVAGLTVAIVGELMDLNDGMVTVGGEIERSADFNDIADEIERTVTAD